MLVQMCFLSLVPTLYSQSQKWSFWFNCEGVPRGQKKIKRFLFEVFRLSFAVDKKRPLLSAAKSPFLAQNRTISLLFTLIFLSVFLPAKASETKPEKIKISEVIL